MRTILIVVAITGLAAALLAYRPAGRALGKDKKPAEKPSTVEIESLIRDLGNTSNAVREKAMKRLRETPSALHQLRRNLAGTDLETRRRMEIVIAELARKRFHERMADLAKEKADAPLDLVAELMLENRRDVGEEQWKQTEEIVAAIGGKLSKGNKGFPNCPHPDLGKRRDEYLVGGAISVDFALGARIIADRLVVTKAFDLSVAILSEGIDSREIGDGILLINGAVNDRAKLGKPLARYGGCFVFCDGDFSSKSGGSIVIARGSVHIERKFPGDIVIENARGSSAVTLFTTERVGMKVVPAGKKLRVEKILPKSRSEKCGVKVGDVIETEEGPGGGISTFERKLRRSYAKETDIELNVLRNGHQEKIVLSFAD